MENDMNPQLYSAAALSELSMEDQLTAIESFTKLAKHYKQAAIRHRKQHCGLDIQETQRCGEFQQLHGAWQQNKMWAGWLRDNCKVPASWFDSFAGAR